MKLTVSDVAGILGLSSETIRYYIREGLIHPEKNSKNDYYEYSSEDVLLISDILFYRDMNLSISNIHKIFDGMDVSQIGTIIDATVEEANAKIREYENIAERLALWRSEYAEELNMVGKFMTGKMPAEVRVVNYYDETDHIVHYLNNNLHFEKNEWLCVSLSFFCDINEDPLMLHRYISAEKNQYTSNLLPSETTVLETHENCLFTCVHFSEDIHQMIDPVIKYAEENGIELTGEFYGRERTNYYINGHRHGLYKLYAPIKK